MADLIFEASRILSIAAFLFYGWICLASDHMVPEFERYGLAKFRRLTGALELLGALGLLVGYVFQPLVAISAGCIFLLMLLAIGTRIRIRDSLLQILPALILGVLNAHIVLYEVYWSAT
ncbi:MAG: hypothetical protein ACI9D0_000094 [Bacteroidia bacterium]|jgi:hypothetical protein